MSAPLCCLALVGSRPGEQKEGGGLPWGGGGASLRRGGACGPLQHNRTCWALKILISTALQAYPRQVYPNYFAERFPLYISECEWGGCA